MALLRHPEAPSPGWLRIPLRLGSGVIQVVVESARPSDDFELGEESLTEFF